MTVASDSSFGRARHCAVEMLDGQLMEASMESQPNNYFPVGAYVGLAPSDQVPSLEAQVATFLQAHCRDLVREGRLDWDGFDVEAKVADDDAPDTDQQAMGRHTPVIERRSPRQPRWGRSRRRLNGGTAP
jgi:hypothetical protein